MVQAADGAASSTAPSAQASPEPPPRLPSADDLLQGSCLGAKLVPPTKFVLAAQKFVKSSSAAEGLGLIGAMNEQPPLAIATGDQHLRSIKQPWDMTVFKISLQSTQL